MAQHRTPAVDLDATLRQLVRTGSNIDAIWPEGDEWVIITEDRIEIRPAGVTHAARLGIGGAA